MAVIACIREKREQLSVRRPRGVTASVEASHPRTACRERVDRHAAGDFERRERPVRADFDRTDCLHRIRIVQRRQPLGARRRKDAAALRLRVCSRCKWGAGETDDSDDHNEQLFHDSPPGDGRHWNKGRWTRVQAPAARRRASAGSPRAPNNYGRILNREAALRSSNDRAPWR